MPSQSEYDAAVKIREWVDQVKYKPGFKFYVDYRAEHYYLTVDMPTKELNPRKRKPTTVSLSRPLVVEGMTKHGVYYLAYTMVKEIENHEIDEWFIAGGKHWSSPHPEYPKYQGRKAFL